MKSIINAFILIGTLLFSQEDIIGKIVILSPGINTRYIETQPGSKGKPNTVKRTFFKGDSIPVYATFDWRVLDSNLEKDGNVHMWFRVGVDEWIYNSVNTTYYVSCYKEDYLTSDLFFTNQEVSMESFHNFIKSFRMNKFTEEEISYIYNAARRYYLNPLMIIVKIEQESQLIKNDSSGDYAIRKTRAMGYNIANSKNANFKVQIDSGCYTLSNRFGEFKQGKRIKYLQNRGYVVPLNAATYALYIYCPIYGSYEDKANETKVKGIVKWQGNKNFVTIQEKFMIKYYTLERNKK